MGDTTNPPNISPDELLQEVVNNKNLPWQMRLDASKALLPYTRKKQALENLHKHSHTIITDERLRLLDDGELRDLIKLVQKLTTVANPDAGGEATKV